MLKMSFMTDIKFSEITHGFWNFYRIPTYAVLLEIAFQCMRTYQPQNVLC